MPGNDTAMYKGVYAPRIAEIGKDGRFTARSSVWRQIDQAIADAAARHQLRIEAEKAGYSHVEIGTVKTSTLFGQQVMITGRLFKQHNAPQDALPIALVEANDRLAGFAVPEKSPKAKRASAKRVKVASLNKPKRKPEAAPARAVRPTGPVVIKAPEFIDDAPARVQ